MFPLPKMFQPQRLALFYHEDFDLPSLSTRIRISEANSNRRIIEGVCIPIMNVIKGVSSYGHLPFTILREYRHPRSATAPPPHSTPHPTTAYVAAYLDRSLIFRLFLFRRRTRFLCHLARIFGSRFFRNKVLRI